MTGTDRTARRAAPGRRALAEEVAIVLALTFLASAVYALIDLLSAPIQGVSRSLYREVGLAKQLADVAFSLVPVWLALHLLRRSGEGPGAIGLSRARLGEDLAPGVGLGLVVAAIGLGIYVAAVSLGLNRAVIPVPPTGHWWTVPVLVLGAAQAGLTEEVIVAGYLLHRLDGLGWAPGRALLASAALRGAYHLYQGLGGFAGNLALGLVFGRIFQRTRRTWALVVAHFAVDLLAGLGYLLFRDRVSFV